MCISEKGLSWMKPLLANLLVNSFTQSQNIFTNHSYNLIQMKGLLMIGKHFMCIMQVPAWKFEIKLKNHLLRYRYKNIPVYRNIYFNIPKLHSDGLRLVCIYSSKSRLLPSMGRKESLNNLDLVICNSFSFNRSRIDL